MSRKYRCRPYFRMRPRAAGIAPMAPFTLPQLLKAYNWPDGLNGGGVIAIVELGGGWVQSDMTSFFDSLNQPVPSIVDVSVDGTKNNPNQQIGDPHDPDLEVALDIQVAGAAYFAAT